MDTLSAKPVLASSDCKTLRAQKSALVIMGVPKYLKRGPAWAQKNLKTEDIYLLKNFILIDEWIRFRCAPLAKKMTAGQGRVLTRKSVNSKKSSSRTQKNQQKKSSKIRGSLSPSEDAVFE